MELNPRRARCATEFTFYTCTVLPNPNSIKLVYPDCLRDIFLCLVSWAQGCSMCAAGTCSTLLGLLFLQRPGAEQTGSLCQYTSTSNFYVSLTLIHPNVVQVWANLDTGLQLGLSVCSYVAVCSTFVMHTAAVQLYGHYEFTFRQNSNHSESMVQDTEGRLRWIWR